MGLLVGLTNTHLVGFGPGTATWAYAPGALATGRWPSILLHPFAHVTLYHLALDAGAFFLLYPLIAPRPASRLILFAGCLLGSISLAACDPRISELGFCGLSGIGHGLMALVALGMAQRARELKNATWLAWGLLIGVCAKAAFEVIGGSAFLAGLHLGDVGTPNTYSHLGGIVGALTVALCVAATSKLRIATI